MTTSRRPKVTGGQDGRLQAGRLRALVDQLDRASRHHLEALPRVLGDDAEGGRREALAKRKTESWEGRHVPERRKAGLTLGELRDLWLERGDAKKKKSAADDKKRFATIVEILGEKMQVASLLPSDVHRLTAQLSKTRSRMGKPMAPATVNRHLENLRSGLNTAEADGWQTCRPKVELLVEENERDRICEPEEYEKLIAAAQGIALAIVLVHWTAMRLGEIVALEWPWIDLGGGMVKLPPSVTKTSKGRTVPLPSEALAALKAWTRSLDGRVFNDAFQRKTRTKSGATTRSVRGSISPAFARLTRELGIVDQHLHDFRHGACTRLRRAGVDIFTIQKISGHKTLEMLKRYNTVTEDDLRAAIARAEVTT